MKYIETPKQLSRKEKLFAILAFVTMLGISIAELHLLPKLVQELRSQTTETVHGEKPKN